MKNNNSGVGLLDPSTTRGRLSREVGPERGEVVTVRPESVQVDTPKTPLSLLLRPITLPNPCSTTGRNLPYLFSTSPSRRLNCYSEQTPVRRKRSPRVRYGSRTVSHAVPSDYILL